MSAESLAGLARHLPGWLASPGAHDGIVIASRVRLARNLAGTAFRRTLPRPGQLELVARILAAAAAACPWPEALHLTVHRLGAVNRTLLSERQLCSRELIDGKHPAALHASRDGRMAIMGNEEDHVRVQAIMPGLDLAGALAQARACEQALGRELPWAFADRLGYLTACHTNVGTGMRASVMLHLPALAETGELKGVLHGAAKLHLAVRGRHGEGSEPTGHVYQISNLRSLGRDEAAISAQVADAAERIVAAEREARTALLAERLRLEDRVLRAHAVLATARILGSDEAHEQLGWLRLGVATGLLPGIGWPLCDRLGLHVQPGHLQAMHKDAAEPAQRDRLRARLVRDSLA